VKTTKPKIEIYDSSLRDGTQAEGINFTLEDKLLIIGKLDELGVDYIEAGWPGANPKDTELFERLHQEAKLKHAKITAFGSTRKASNTPENDQVLNNLVQSKAKVICIFGKSWDLHVKQALNISLEENLKLVEDSISYLKSFDREVFFDAEHFFDGYKSNPEYAVKVLKAAAKGGASRIVLCDTNGGTLPHEVEEIIQKIKKSVKVNLGIHCHNDSGVAVANSLAAVREGAIQVQGCLTGIGERCGNTNLATVVANLELKMGYKTFGPKKLSRLKEITDFINELANKDADRQQPYVGRSAFAHKGGVHIHAILKNSKTYEHIDPKKVGNEQRILLSDLSGAATISYKLKKFGVDIDSKDPKVKKLLEEVKNKERLGFVYEGAEASFEILIKKHLKKYKSAFKLHDFKIVETIDDETSGNEQTSKANVHLSVNSNEEKSTAKGVGPVHALDLALRKALVKFYPKLESLKLIDYKVRVLSSGTGTASKVRVLIEFSNGEKKWNTVGVSENIIHASYQAVKDAIDYHLKLS
jgi:2-isopropylmalate synthase